ncbi:GNAT family protein [Clostridium sp. KNHs214]|uniref:GNAT family N-acetyltransferase n=1 Tax=Clostridium sp. KNHs214 TaxID=1540257 RepID=UPI00054F41B9|nr:GNAT family protein [Clostridium sp. KNHs214]
MELKEITYPEIIQIENNLRLRILQEEDYKLALPWYHNEKVMYYSEGVKDKVYNIEKISCMYNYLNGIGELYLIEILEKEEWRAIGDVTLSEENMPIVIGEEKYWGLGIGRKVIKKLLERGNEIGLSKTKVEIYKYNNRSKNLFLSLGFTKVSENEKSYKLEYVF